MNVKALLSRGEFVEQAWRSVRLATAFLGASLLFSVLPLARGWAGRDEDRRVTRSKEPVMVMQQVRTQERVPEQPLRSVRTVSDSRSPGRSTRGMGFSMRFAPDLSVGGTGDGVGLAAGGGGEAVFDESDVDELPRPLVRTAVDYPRRARDAGIEGTVSLVLLIGRTGSVLDVTVESAPSSLFVKPVEQAVRQWRFSPARNQGVPVQVRMRQNITFKLDS